MKTNAFRSVAFAIVCMILGILIALQMKNINVEKRSESDLAELQTKVIEYAQKNEELSLRNTQLNAQINLLENDMATGNDKIQAIITEKNRAAIFAGLTEVKNFGLEIQISCPEGIAVSEAVLSKFVNELRSMGAQAIAVNDERMVSMSEIRDNNGTIIINGNAWPSAGKFVIKAIIDPKKEAASIENLNIVRSIVIAHYTLDNYNIQIGSVPELTIPALSESSTAFKIDLLIPAEQP